mgnify:CR=1 FL=1
MFAALGNGGQVQVPLTKTFFSPRFGMLADRFRVSWMVTRGVLRRVPSRIGGRGPAHQPSDFNSLLEAQSE